MLYICQFHKFRLTVKSLSRTRTKHRLFLHSRANYCKANSVNWPKLQIDQEFIAVLFLCQFDKDAITIEVKVRYCISFFDTQRPVFPWRIVQCGQHSTSEILRLSWLLASLKMIRSKMKELLIRHFLHYKNNKYAKSIVYGGKSNLTKFFIPALITCKFYR